MHRWLLVILVSVTPFLLKAQSSLAERKVKIEVTSGQVGEILDEIARKGEFSFSYDQQIRRDEQVSVTKDSQTVRAFLDEIFRDRVYAIEYGNKLILAMKPKLPEYYTITGKVVDKQTGEALPGVTVQIPGSVPLEGTATDQLGYFRIRVPAHQPVVKLSCIGYESSSLNPSGSRDLRIELNPEMLSIVEVQIQAYKPLIPAGKNVTLSEVNARQIDATHTGNIENVLEGNVSGVHTVHNSGMPGSSLQVRVRGVHSLISSAPAYYLDGMPIQETMLHGISPYDIESVKILKDPSSTALYGARGANGVILLQSRLNSDEPFSASFDINYGTHRVWKMPDLLTAEEYLEWFKIFRPTNQSFSDINVDSIVNTDWPGRLFHPAHTMTAHLSLAGGDDRSRYYFSAGKYMQEAMVQDLAFDRYSIKFRSEHKAGERIRLGQDQSVSFIRMKGLSEGCFMNDHNNPILGAMRTLPYIEPDDTLQYRLQGMGPITVATIDTLPYYELANSQKEMYTFLNRLYLNIRFSDHFRMQTTLSGEILFQDNTALYQDEENPGFTMEKEYHIADLSLNFQQSATYQKVFRDQHNLSIQAGIHAGNTRSSWIPLTQRNFIGTNPDPAGNLGRWKPSVGTEFAWFSLHGQMDYLLRERYLLQASITQEAVSYEYGDAPGIIRGNFPSVRAGWIFTREQITIPAWINYGKLWYGWGRAGSSPRINYSFFANYLQEIQYVYSSFDNIESPSTPDFRKGNDRFYWLSSEGHNIGLDLGFFNNQLFSSVNVFSSISGNSTTYPVDKPANIYMELTNAGYFGIARPSLITVKNYGADLDLTFRTGGKDFQWNAGLNLSHVRSRILQVNDDAEQSEYTLISVNLEGEEPGSFYGYVIEKLFTAEDCNDYGLAIRQPFKMSSTGIPVYAQRSARAGDYKFADVYPDSVIDEKDRTILGSPHPDLSIGLYQSLQFRNITFSFLLQGTYGNEIFNLTKFWTYHPYGFSNWSSDIKNSYRAPDYADDGTLLDPGNTDTELHRIDANNLNKNLRISDFYVEDGSYLRLKNVQIGYILPERITLRAYVKEFRIYLAARNLLTLTRYSGLDPEVGGWGIDAGIYPQPRTYICGISIKF